MADTITNTLLAYLAGILTAAGGAYFGNKYTDQRRAREIKKEADDRFRQIAATMPKLIKEMRNDLAKPEFKMVRNFFVLSNPRVSFYSDGRYLFYYQDKHADLLNSLELLESHGYIIDRTKTNTPKYLMTEEFVEYVLKFDIAPADWRRN
ncbi:MAG: hypothetical protein PHP45_00215 [Elusimicrobiales bacterium]|nr:hypothetical protein [Elusimicrobiales bacterium]